jgi:putative thiamine transport system ATP-binding protein
MSIEIKSLHKSFGSFPAVNDVTLHIETGEMVAFLGPSGSGKSSLLGAIIGTLPPDMHFAGTISLLGRRIDLLPTEQRAVGILFQDDLLFAHMNVFENLLFGVPAGPRAERRARVAQGLRDLDMEPFASADPSTLSGGQRARVALMRALLAEPKALLLDEPFSRLDAQLRSKVREFVFALVRKRAIPVLMVTHDAQDIADPAQVTRLG